MEQYFGIKELYEVVLKANTDMTFGARQVEAGEPILYFEKVSIASLSEQSKPILARGGWGNMPYVVWEDRSEMTFTLSEGVVSSLGLGILTSAKMIERGTDDILYIHKKEGPFELDSNNQFLLSKTPSVNKKSFCYEYERKSIQKKVDFEIDDKKIFIKDGEQSKEYILDYYFEYGEKATIYLIEKERFNGTFSLEGKFYTKDENDGINTTNILFMPKVRVVSDINLRLGERADPTTSVFKIIAMPQRTDDSRTMLMKMIHLNEDID